MTSELPTCYSTPTMGRAGSQAGFTLLELLVALAVLSLILAAIPQTLQLGRRALQTSERVDADGALAVVRSLLEHRIARALPLIRRDATGATVATFVGRRDSIILAGSSGDGPMGAGLFLIEVATRPADGARTALVLRWSPYRPIGNADQAGAAKERVLVADLGTFGLRYFGRQNPGGERGWTDTWTSANALPDLVEFELSAAAGVAAPAVVVELLVRELP